MRGQASGLAARDRGVGALDRAPSGGPGVQLRRRLIASGAVAARFGIYLGSRVDLLCGADCRQLLEIPDRAPGSPAGLVAELIDRELGAPPEELFQHFDPEPFDSGLVFQWHHAHRLDGENLTVQVVHPELVSELEGRVLRGLADRLIAGGVLPVTARVAVGEFERRLDLEAAAAALDRFAEETADSRWVEIPEAQRRLWSPRVRVFSAVDGRPATSLAAEEDRRALETRARRLARVWLAMVLRGDPFPVEPWGRSLRYLEKGRVAFVEGEVRRLPRYVLADLREYLAAVAASEPARAALAFMDLVLGKPTDHHLRFRLRHADPFRDRGLDIGGDLFARQVLAHWRAADELGYRLPEELSAFYRGLFLLSQEVQRLTSGDTPLRDGFREARLLLIVGELREEVAERPGGILEGQLRLLSGLPQKLDRILTLAAERDESESDNRRSVVTAEREPRRRNTGLVAACLLALTAVVVLTRYVAETAGFGGWTERTGALLVLLLGGLLLKAVMSSGDD